MNLNRFTGSFLGDRSLKNICVANLPTYFNPVNSDIYCFILSIDMINLFLSAMFKKFAIILNHVVETKTIVFVILVISLGFTSFSIFLL